MRERGVVRGDEDHPAGSVGERRRQRVPGPAQTEVHRNLTVQPTDYVSQRSAALWGTLEKWRFSM